jgi:hypothetical protein
MPPFEGKRGNCHVPVFPEAVAKKEKKISLTYNNGEW